MERKSSIDRITQALSMLKADLMEMRSQDVKLMRQLISINTAISNITNNRDRNPVMRSASFGSMKRPNLDRINKRSADIVCNLKNPLVRHRSAPLVGELRRSEAFDHSFDDSLEELSGSPFESESDLESLSGSSTSLSPEVYRNCHLSYMRPLPEEDDVDEKKYHGILMKNIKLWKYSQESVDSSFSNGS
ncbi:uncharacterized protein LOC133185801 [Saccostrea echinata]|uniref:uncharacterized protein LOC133185801 n=1 Tax=Saccostrea echinata TaxID=191078 RepID=UPI002A840763|nr:uncharacterized protein LOC133185801 [Saccostrea echinata]